MNVWGKRARIRTSKLILTVNNFVMEMYCACKYNEIGNWLKNKNKSHKYNNRNGFVMVKRTLWMLVKNLFDKKVERHSYCQLAFFTINIFKGKRLIHE